MGIVVGHRSLLAPHAWPGCVLGYEIVRDRRGEPALRLTARFDRARSRLSDEAMVAIWSSIRRNARDRSLEIAVLCSLQGDSAVGRPTDAVHRYRALVERLFRGITRGGGAPVTAAMTLPLDRDAIARRTDPLLPLSVVLTLARRRGPSTRERVRSPLPPRMPGPVAGHATRFPWARKAESALAGCDDPGSGVMLARPLRTAKTFATLWALRWGGSHGVALGREGVPPVAFVARPFATDLLSGEVTATIWNEALEPETVRRAYHDVDVDAAFDRVVAILDLLAPPDRTTLRGNAVPAARHAAARAVARQLIPAGGGHDSDTTTDLAEAVAQAVGSRIADFRSAWVRYRFAASQPGARVRLGGVVCGVPTLSGEDRLPVDVLHGTGGATRLDVPVSSRPEADRATSSLRPTWTLTDVDCLDGGDEAYPTGRLVPVLSTPRGGKVDIALDPVDVPSISTLYPEPVRLIEQQAFGCGAPSGRTLADIMAEATRWSFAFTIARGALDRRDDVWLRLAFDRPSVPAAANRKPALTPLACGLLRFEAGYHSLTGLAGGDRARNAALAGALNRVVARLAEDLGGVPAAPPADPAASTATEATSVWVWRDRPNQDGGRSLFVRVDPADPEDLPPFPTVAGCMPVDRGPPPPDRAPGAGAWREAVYHLPESAGTDPLPFVLGGLDLLSHHGVAIEARVVRNMCFNLDPRLVRATGWTPPGPLVIPPIDLAMPPTVSPGSASFEPSLVIALYPFCSVGDRIGGERMLRVELVHRQPLAMPDGEAGLVVSTPILSMSLGPDEDTGATKLAAALTEGYRSWAAAFPSERGGGRVSLSAVLTIGLTGSPVPLLTVRELDLPGLSGPPLPVR